MTESTDRITCQEVTELVTEFIEGTLGPHETAVFEQHLNFCDGCDWYVDQMRTTIGAVGRIEPAGVPPELRDSLLAAFRERRRA